MPKRIIIVPMVLLLCLGCGRDERPQYTEEELAQIPQPVRGGLPRPSGGFVLAVGSETITSTEISAVLLPRLGQAAQQMSFDEFVPQAMPAVATVLRDKVADILLYQQAKKAASEDIDAELDKAVEKEMRRFIVSFGGDYAKAEAFLQNYYKMGWKEFRDYQRRMILSGSYLHNQLAKETPVTYSEIRQYYQQHKEVYSTEGTITIRLIDIDVSRVAADANSSQNESAKVLAKEIMGRLESGEDFGQLAMQYSHGYRASSGGLWQPVRPQSLAEPYDVIAGSAEEMAVGEVAGPIEAKGHILIVKLEGKETGSVVPFEQVQGEIEQVIVMERKSEAFDKAMSKVMEEAAISGLDEFAMFCLEEIYTQANSQL